MLLMKRYILYKAHDDFLDRGSPLFFYSDHPQMRSNNFIGISVRYCDYENGET